eukprot:g5639.t1
MIVRVISPSADLIASFELDANELAASLTVDGLKNHIRLRAEREKSQMPQANDLMFLSLLPVRYHFDGWIYPNKPLNITANDWEKTCTLKALGVLDVAGENGSVNFRLHIVAVVVIATKQLKESQITDLALSCHARCIHVGMGLERNDIDELEKKQKDPNYSNFRMQACKCLQQCKPFTLSSNIVRRIVEFASPENVTLSEEEVIKILDVNLAMKSLTLDCRCCCSQFQVYFLAHHRVIDLKLAVVRSHLRLFKNSFRSRKEEKSDNDSLKKLNVKAIEDLMSRIAFRLKFYRSQFIREIWDHSYDLDFWYKEIINGQDEDGRFSLLG